MAINRIVLRYNSKCDVLDEESVATRKHDLLSSVGRPISRPPVKLLYAYCQRLNDYLRLDGNDDSVEAVRHISATLCHP